MYTGSRTTSIPFGIKLTLISCLADIRVFQATDGSTDSSPLLFGAEAVLWPRAAKKSEKWNRGVVDAADRFMKRWHKGEAEKGWLRQAAEDDKSGDKRKLGGRGGEAAVLIQLSTEAETI